MAVNVDQARSIFLAAIEAGPDERRAFLDGACNDDGELRARVEHLLEAHQALGSIHFHPIPGPAANAGEQSSERPGSVIGPYKLIEAIGEGGMGTVYLAEQERPVRRKVALKIIKPGMDSAQVIARFEAERQALALMDHPHIAKVLEAGTMGSGRPFFVMELVKGIPITRFCDEHRLTIRDRLELFVPVCQAVQHAHQKGIIHRDLKPSNVLVALHDDKPLPQVIDFGVAKATGDRLTEPTTLTGFGSVVGTLEYMSPEQAGHNDRDVDTRSDVYSLGVLLYELLTGTTPLDRQRLGQASFDELLRIIREEEPPMPSTRLSGSVEALAVLSARRRAAPAKLPGLVRGELDWIVMKALEKDRARRYETANGLARDLQRYLADEPVEAGPSSAGYRVRKLTRRYKNALATAAAFVLLLALAAALSTWQAVRATRAERAERAERDRAVAAEKQAKTEQANAKAALDFLWKDVLSQASYRNEPDRDLTVRTLLDRVADRLARALANRRWWRPRSVKWSVVSISIKGSIARPSRTWKRPWRCSAANSGRRTRRPSPPCTTSVIASIAETVGTPLRCSARAGTPPPRPGGRSRRHAVHCAPRRRLLRPGGPSRRGRAIAEADAGGAAPGLRRSASRDHGDDVLVGRAPGPARPARRS